MVRIKKSKAGTNISGEFRRLGVMIEHVDDKVSLVAEQHGEIVKTLGMVQEDIRAMKKDMEVTKQDIEFIKHGFKKKVDVDEFAALERRVSLLERRR